MQPPADMSTPSLVRELVALRCADARGERFGRGSHARLVAVEKELRERNILD